VVLIAELYSTVKPHYLYKKTIWSQRPKVLVSTVWSSHVYQTFQQRPCTLSTKTMFSCEWSFLYIRP